MSEFLLGNIWLRALLPLILTGIAGLAGNLLASEILVGQDIIWSSIPTKVPFYVFAVATILLCVYQVEISRHDKDLLKGFTAKQYEAAIRNKVAEDVAKRSKKLIQEGDIAQLEKETEIFKKLYGEANK